MLVVSQLDSFNALIRKMKREEDNSIRSINERVKSLSLLAYPRAGFLYLGIRWSRQISIKASLSYVVEAFNADSLPMIPSGTMLMDFQDEAFGLSSLHFSIR